MKKNYILLLATILISAMSFGQVAGDIIVTEIMQNPLAPIDDNDAEFFEVYNTTGSAIDLDGWTITDDGSNTHLITGSVIVSAGGFAVLGKSTDTTINGGVAVDYAYGTDIALANGSDEIILTSFGGTEIDRVAWDNGATFPDPEGHSMNLDNALFNGTDNDNGLNWCESVTPLGPTQFGTPGAANETCAEPCLLNLGTRTATCDATTAGVDTYTVTIDFTGGAQGTTYNMTNSTGTVSGDDPSAVVDGTITITGINEGTDLSVNVTGGTCNLTADVTSPLCIPATCAAVGSVIINELMQNPLAPINDSEAEWFELYNTTGTAIDLEGWNIIDDNNPSEGFVIPTSLIIPANGYLLFANNGDAATNGGLPTPDFVYVNGFPFLGNGTDGLTVQCGGAIIDIVIWDNGATFPDPNGASMSLNISSQDTTANDDGANWSEEAAFTYGPTGQFGTPGGPNDTQVSVNDNQIEGFSVYPNPVVNNRITINTLSTSVKNIVIYSILGKQVYSNSVTGTNSVINLGKINTGIYFLKVTEGTNTATRKLVIK